MSLSFISSSLLRLKLGKLKSLLLLVLLCFPIMLSAQNKAFTYRDQGSAPILKGKIYVLTIFISTGNFPQQEKQEIMDAVRGAEEWIMKQAKRYGKIISFQNGNYGYDHTIVLNSIPAGNATGHESTDIIMPVMRELGYTRYDEFYNWVLKDTDCTSCVVLLVANTPGTSYSIIYDKAVDAKYFTEGCMLYTKYRDGRKLLPASIAHEILHCFGAWDLYENFAISKKQAERASVIYPDDIMRRVDYNINKLTIDPLTAWRVGLINDYSPEYDYFTPNY